jgi:hypothetical protein
MLQEMDDSPELTELEISVLETALDPGNAEAQGFRAQVGAARAVVRTPSGVGFVTKLQVPEELFVPNSHGAVSLPIIQGDHPDLPSGAEFVLQVRDGRLNSIEAFCFEGMWPSDESLFEIKVKR